jgi:hypothetical protein
MFFDAEMKPSNFTVMAIVETGTRTGMHRYLIHL